MQSIEKKKSQIWYLIPKAWTQKTELPHKAQAASWIQIENM